MWPDLRRVAALKWHQGARRLGRTLLLGLMLGVLVFTGVPAASAAPDLSTLPLDLQKYSRSFPAWMSSPWVTSAACRDHGGDFSSWTRSVITDTPSLLAYFQASAFGPNASAAERPRNDAIMAGYRDLADQLSQNIPLDYCVDDMKRWAGGDIAMLPFGFPWGVTTENGHQTAYSCRIDATDRNSTRQMEYNRVFGAERAPCDGFYVNCSNAAEVDKSRCETWNVFSDSYVRRVDQLRSRAINDHRAGQQNDTDTELTAPDPVSGWFIDLAKSLARGAGVLLAHAMTFWTRVDRSEMLESPAITEIQQMLRYVGIVLLTGGVIWQGIMMIVRRKMDPLISTGVGLLSFAGWSSLGGTIAVLLNEAGAALAAMVLGQSIIDFADQVGASLIALAAAAPGVVFFLAIVLLILGGVQWALGFFRQGALTILLALLPTAAAGQLTDATKPWLKTILSWCLTLILYQPIAAVVFSIGFKLMGSSGDNMADVLVGMAVIALALVAMPTMLRFFTWGGQQLTASGGGGSGAMAMSAAATALGTGSSGFSKFMDRTGPGGDQSASSGSMPVSSVAFGDGPGDQPNLTDNSRADQPSDSAVQPTGNSGASPRPAAAVDTEAGTSPTSPASGADTGSPGAGTAGAGSTAASAAGSGAAAVHPAAAAAAEGKDQVSGGISQSAQAATGAMTDGVGERRGD
jgi:hypothetical protein